MSTTPLNRPPHEQPEDKPLIYGETPDQVIQGHKYDGIKEYDNPMPGWWVWLFYASIAFAAFYYVGITFFGFIDTYGEDLAESQQQLQQQRVAYAEANPTFAPDEASLARYVGNTGREEAGAVHYQAICAACHGDQGQGSIGPNLTDAYWIYGHSNLDLYEAITVGFPDRGMPPWDAVLSPEERGEVVAFLRTLEGTNPPNAKEPQGELVE